MNDNDEGIKNNNDERQEEQQQELDLSNNKTESKGDDKVIKEGVPSYIITLRKSSGRPATPHRFFESSYNIAFHRNDTAATDSSSTPSNKKIGFHGAEEGTTQRPSALARGEPVAIDDENKTARSSNIRHTNNDERAHDMASSSKESSNSSDYENCMSVMKRYDTTRMIDGGTFDDSNDEERDGQYQIVHRHANGLCIVTAGYIVRDAMMKSEGEDVSIVGIEFMASETERQSVGGKKKTRHHNNGGRRCGGNNNGGRHIPGLTHPNDPLAVITLSDGTHIELKCCVHGTLLELNTRLSMMVECNSLLKNDPLLDGYLAILMPIGKKSSFPPPSNH